MEKNMEMENVFYAEIVKLWKRKRRKMKRYNAYGWLSKQMKLTRDEGHIALFEIEQCKQVIDICQKQK